MKMTLNYDEEYDVLGISFQSFLKGDEIISEEKLKKIDYYIMRTLDGKATGIEILNFKKQFT